ncbi:MAG: DUF554 domain-containing protein [Anaerolineae bacterium]|nr:DUF554 domain-containing protein [Anaerolineae bacterium]
MTGTLINVFTVILGSVFGLLFGSRIPERTRQTIVHGLGLITLAYGTSMFLDTQNMILVVISILIGGLLGEWIQLEERIHSIGKTLESRFIKGATTGDNLGRGFLAATLLFCVGPMAILGSIQDGLTGDYNLLAIKSIMDGFASMAFSTTLGAGVILSAIPVFLYQGGISLLAGELQNVITPTMMNEMVAVGGIILMALSISSLLEIKSIRVANFLPALVIAPLIIALLELFHIALP